MADLKPKPPTTVWGQAFERALQAGFSVVIGFLGGYYADRWLGTPYIFMVLGLVVGGIAGVRALLQIPVPPPTEASASTSVAAQSESGRRPAESYDHEASRPNDRERGPSQDLWDDEDDD